MRQGVLSISGLSIVRGGLQILDGVTLEVLPRKCHLIIGPNGAGKTSLFNAITGQYKADSGSIEFSGCDITNWSISKRARFGISRTFQIASLFFELTVAQNIRLALLAPKHTNDRIESGVLNEKINDALDRAGLKAKSQRRAGELSYGEQRQLEIGLGLATDPQLLLLDEPMAGLTAQERKHLSSILSQLRRDVSIVLIEHNLDDVFGIADDISVLHLGKKIFAGSGQAVKDSALVQDIYVGRKFLDS